jgi:hypothetical protein
VEPTPPSKTPTEAIQEMEEEDMRIGGSDLSSATTKDNNSHNVAHKEGENTDDLLPTMTQSNVLVIVIVAVVALIAIAGCWWYNTNEPTTHTSTTRCLKKPHHYTTVKGHQVYHRVASRKEDELPTF